MSLSAEPLAGEFRADTRVILRREAHKILRKQHLLVKTRVEIRREANGEIKITSLKTISAMHIRKLRLASEGTKSLAAPRAFLSA